MKIVLSVAVLGLGAVVVMSPWIIRNYELVHQVCTHRDCRGSRGAGGALYV